MSFERALVYIQRRRWSVFVLNDARVVVGTYIVRRFIRIVTVEI